MLIPKLLKLLTLIWLFGLTALATTAALAQTNNDFTVEVAVADPGESQRSSAYWLALDRVLRRTMPADSIDETTRSALLKDAARYVQAYRYRQFDLATDGDRLLSTRKVREGASVDSVIIVTFPASLPGIVRQQNQSIEFVEEEVIQGTGRILALIAVEQNGQQFLIGGDRGKKFQSRLLQLGAANNLSFEFPLLDTDDFEIVTPISVLRNEADRLTLIMEKYNSSSRLTGALVRLSADAWQSEWNLARASQQPLLINLTTRSLDEALITAITEIAGSEGQSFSANGYLGDGVGFQRSGVALRVENINSLARYEQALTLLQAIEPAFITEALEPDATVFRAANLDAVTLQQRLARQPRFSPLPVDGLTTGLSYRFQ